MGVIETINSFRECGKEVTEILHKPENQETIQKAIAYEFCVCLIERIAEAMIKVKGGVEDAE